MLTNLLGVGAKRSGTFQVSRAHARYQMKRLLPLGPGQCRIGSCYQNNATASGAPGTIFTEFSLRLAADASGNVGYCLPIALFNRLCDAIITNALAVVLAEPLLNGGIELTIGHLLASLRAF
jgi:hypothetical protein